MNSEPELTEIRQGARPRKKSTKKWCRGKVGVEHEYEWEEKKYYGNFTYHVERCQKCSKERNWRFAGPNRI